MKSIKILSVISLFLLLSLNLFCDQGKGSFEIGQKSFLLNGKPFIIKAAEIHYARIPAEYWEHRIKMCKALGMNTICIYAFWNYHEQTPGDFDFSGQKDIAEFCRLVKKHDMYIIVRPGPYACAEWEMGGLPWWLLKKHDIKVRSDDPYFLERCSLYLKELGKQLAGMQITRGGNVIMVQVENEYGAYNTDKEYVADIRDMVKNAGFTDVPLFQCDWASNFRNNGLDDLLWTINFGTGANIQEQFKELQEVRPNSPLMCSEFWSGWFDHWGRAHETRDATTMIAGLKEMLDNNISFSLYMAHGGTTFGHWGGANSPAYSAMCSSYDYDAPISEAGWVTPKYHALREMLSGYLDKDEVLPEIPDAMPIIEIPEIRFTESAMVFDNLPKAVKSKEVKPMEDLDQGWGSILYRTSLPVIKEETTLVITEPHDWAQIFIDGKLITRLDRRKGQNSVKLPITNATSRLDILIEAMGRVNFDEAIHDRKGITERVELVNEKGTNLLNNWEIFSLPVDYSFVKNKQFTKNTRPQSLPAYYRATFNLGKAGDVFFDMRTWGKGMVWVNGKAIGRFWEIGPQQTLFMPGCWLKEGENEIIVLDLKGPKDLVVKGLTYPILDMLRPEESLTHRKDGETLNLSNETPVYNGTFSAGNGWKEINFGKITEARYICIEALNSYNGDSNAAIAELYITGADGKHFSRQAWKIVYADSEEIKAGNHSADKVFDLQESTYWSTKQEDKFPHYIIIDLGKLEKIKGLKLLPRMEKEVPGLIKDYSIYVKKNLFNIK
ncbi:beta-galactosidase [Dysgonomonas hofstadii]|uniref:Beta-galactosidase n=1 Tax=Dysgonomonas hofstadii TaxID=637886 RepID=A0A840CG74_9BACT|nr:beta-galactosidase [Dysgonomonas hofstadii]MBB4034176.1 beta-galactosidase [Dysgonomonas hofstadii]